jgi:hypothetical protein
VGGSGVGGARTVTSLTVGVEDGAGATAWPLGVVEWGHVSVRKDRARGVVEDVGEGV